MKLEIQQKLNDQSPAEYCKSCGRIRGFCVPYWGAVPVVGLFVSIEDDLHLH